MPWEHSSSSGESRLTLLVDLVVSGDVLAQGLRWLFAGLRPTMPEPPPG
jgi:hypothetical protein